MDDVGLFLCGPGQLGEGGGVAAFTHCIHRVRARLDVHLQCQTETQAKLCVLAYTYCDHGALLNVSVQ